MNLILQYLNRAHSAKAINCVRSAQDMGFNNVPWSLIYAIPAPDHAIYGHMICNSAGFHIHNIFLLTVFYYYWAVFGNWLK